MEKKGWSFPGHLDRVGLNWLCLQLAVSQALGPLLAISVMQEELFCSSGLGSVSEGWVSIAEHGVFPLLILNPVSFLGVSAAFA